MPAAVSAGVSGTGDDGAGAARACAAAGVDVSCVSARAGGVGSAVDGVDGAVAALAGGVTSGLAAVGGAGAAEACIALLSLQYGIAPPTANLERIGDDIGLDVVANEVREIGHVPVLSNSFGFGGHNAALILAPVE